MQKITSSYSVFLEHVRNGVAKPRGRPVAKEKHGSEGWYLTE